MNQNFFWNNWDSNYRQFFQTTFASGILLILVYVFLIYSGNESTIDWFVNSSLSAVDYPIAGYQHDSGLLNFNIQLFFVDQKFVGGQPLLNEAAGYIYFSVFVLSVLLCFTIATYLGKFWYTISVGLFMVLLISLRFETLAIFGMQNQLVSIVVFLLFVLPSYYFNSINEGISLTKRYAVFIALALITGGVVYFFSNTAKPFQFLIAHSFIAAVVFAIIFIFLVSHEIVYGILKVTTENSLNSNNTRHFVILSLVYLVNVGLLHMKNVRFIDWDIIYINAFLLLIPSALIGYWGVKSREILYGNILPFYPYTALLYSALVVSTFSFISFHAYIGNDVTLEVAEEVIVMGHLGFGSMFFVYIIMNFINYLLKNLPVYKIAYKEDNFPYFTSRLAGIIVVAALFFSSNQVAKEQGISAFFNGLGDAFMKSNNVTSAENQYHNSFTYVKWNHKANYMLGFLREKPEDRIKAFNQATLKNPSEFAYINLGLEYEQNDQFFEALFAYQDGLKQFPKSSHLKNNLAMLYAKTDVHDSTLFYLSDLSSTGFEKDVIKSNLMSVSAKNGIDFTSISSIPSLENYRYDINANLIGSDVLMNNDTLNRSLVVSKNSRMNLIKYAYLNNLAIKAYENGNADVVKLLDKYLADSGNSDFHERLNFLKSINLYALGQVGLAFELLNNLIHSGSDPMYYRLLAAIWSLEMNSPKLAEEFLDVITEEKNPQAQLYLAMAYFMQNDPENVDRVMTELESSKDSLVARIPISEAVNLTLRFSKIEEHRSISEAKLERAWQLVEEDKSLLAEGMYTSLGMDQPFLEVAVLEAVKFFNDQNNPTQAYEMLIKAIEVNKYSEVLIKAYIDQCLSMNFFTYAESGLLKLLDVLSPEAFSAYEIEYDNKRRALETEAANWGEEEN